MSGEAEKATLGGMLLSPSAVDDARTIVRPDDFYDPRHEAIAHGIYALHATNKPVDPLSVIEHLVTTGVATRVEVSYVATLPDHIPTAANTAYYATIVRESAQRRAVVQAGNLMVGAADEAIDIEDAKTRARVILEDLDKDRVSTAGTTFGELIPEVLDVETVQSLTTPWPELDRWMTGLRPGGLYVVAARPGVGKTIVGSSIAWNTAQCGKRALLFSVEMTRTDMARRIMSAAAGVDYARLMRGWINDAESATIAALCGREAVDRLLIEDTTRLTVDDIRAISRARHREPDGLAVVVVDYLQLLTSVDKRLPREQQVSEQSRAMKILAGELGIPVVLVAQLNRQSEARADRKPLMSDLRESGAVEQDADAVLLLWRDELGAPDQIDMTVAKNRFGMTGTLPLDFAGQYQRITSRETRW